jgi:hypothetical protein
MAYVIEQNFIKGVPNVPFRNGKGEGVVNHCTDNPNHSGGDTPTTEHNFESRTFNNAWVHFFVGVENRQPKIIQNSSLASGCYGAGPTANSRYWQIELCMYDDPTLFKIAYDAYVWLTAKLLFDAKLGVTDNKTLLSHKEVADDWHETTHSDPIQYLASHGVSWSQHVTNVMNKYRNMLQPSSPFIQVVRVLCETDIRADHSHTSGYIKNGHAGEVYNVIERYGDWHRVILDNKGNSGWIDGNNGNNLFWVR